MYFAFLRAINVGGHTVRMDELCSLFRSLKYKNVEAFIASGNIRFDSTSRDARSLEKAIESKLQKELGYEVSTFVRTDRLLSDIAVYRPFSAKDMEEAKTLNIAFLKRPLDRKQRDALKGLASPIDDFHVHGSEMYWLCKKKQSESDFSNQLFEKKLGVKTTFRGINTIQRMIAKYCIEET